MTTDFIGLTNFGSTNDPDLVRAMNQGEIAEYIRRQGDPTNVPLSARNYVGMQNAWRQPVLKPTMTLSEFDARLAAFKVRLASA